MGSNRGKTQRLKISCYSPFNIHFLQFRGLYLTWNKQYIQFMSLTGGSVCSIKYAHNEGNISFWDRDVNNCWLNKITIFISAVHLTRHGHEYPPRPATEYLMLTQFTKYLVWFGHGKLIYLTLSTQCALYPVKHRLRDAQAVYISWSSDSKFWIYKVHVGNIYLFLRIMHFQHWKNKDKHLTIKQQS